MNGKERISRILKHQPVDRIGIYEHFWGDTYNTWRNAGKIEQDEDLSVNLNFDIYESSFPLNLTADIDYVPEIISETADTVTKRDGNKAILKRHKHHDSTPEHIGFGVTDRESWESIKPLLSTVDARRINFEAYRNAKKIANDNGMFFVVSGVNVFESMHPVCGHENLLVGMALDPDWIHDMADTYSKLIVSLQRILFEQEGYPDGIWYYEDMGFKEHPFMSPAMYRELIKPYHKYTIDYAKSLNLPVIMHSCGYIEPLLPDIIDAGIDCLQVIEVKAGMDLLKIHRLYGDKIALMGGIDVRVLYTNEKDLIDRELESKIPVVKNGFGFVLHSDHSIPNTVGYDTYRYFIKKGLELGKYE